MKGLRKLALSCMLFGCATHAAATQMAGALQMPDPLVYFGAESFDLDDAKGLNRARAEMRLGFSSSTPSTVSSFLGQHAGQTLQFSREDALSLQMLEIPAANAAQLEVFMRSIPQNPSDRTPEQKLALLNALDMAWVAK